MFKKFLSKIILLISKPVIQPLEHKLNRIENSLNFLINNSLDITKIEPKPSVRDVQIEIFKLLEKLNAFLETKNLDYFLFAGTLLGSVRHKGFIPWDDDIDVGMVWDDFLKLLDHEDDFEKFGLKFSSPYSKNENYSKAGWHRIYTEDSRFTLSIFLFDIVRTDNLKRFMDSRLENHHEIHKRYRIKYLNNQISFSDLRKGIDEYNEVHFENGRRIKKEMAGESDFIIKAITSTNRQIWVPFSSVFPLKKGEFIVLDNQKNTEYPVPNNPFILFENFYGKNYMSFPKDLSPQHFL